MNSAESLSSKSNIKGGVVVMIPDYRPANPYQTLLGQTLESHGWSVIFDKIRGRSFLFSRLIHNHPDLQVIHLHWIADIVKHLTRSESGLKFYLRLVLLAFDCLLVRARGVKVIWTIHNKFSHQQYDHKKELLIRKVLSACTSRNILHSKEALQQISNLYSLNLSKKTSVIFHGSYHGYYPQPSSDKRTLRAQKNYSKDDLVILFFGMIRPYKNIEPLLTHVNETNNKNVKLIIAGQPVDKDYMTSIINLAVENENIKIDNRFLSDQELIDYLSLSDVIALPFSDTLTSGSVILSMTMGKPLILPNSARIFGCVPEDGVMYFNTNEELKSVIDGLTETKLVKMGQKNLICSKELCWEKVGQMTIDNYTCKRPLPG